MSLNVSGSRYVKVYDKLIRPTFSDKVLLARLVTSRKTGRKKIDEATGDVLVNSTTGMAVEERAYSHWNARFVGGAFEAAKGLREGQSIDITNGWIVEEEYTTREGRRASSSYVVIAEFMISDIENIEMDVES